MDFKKISTVLDYTKSNGLVFCNNLDDVKNNSELLYITEAKKLGVNAVFFRRFYNEKSSAPSLSEPAVCIFDKEDDFFNSKEHIELHAAIWSAGKNEIYILISNLRIDIINARRPAQVIDKNELSVENLILAKSAIKEFNDVRFSAHLFASGTFWEQTEFEKELDEKNSPYIYLLDYLMTVRKDFLNANKIKLDPSTTDKLLVICILIKFLEEIKDDRGKHTLRSIYKKNKIENFAEAIEQGLCLTILNDLGNEFNGQIFDSFTAREKTQIQNNDLTLLSQFLRANINLKTKQLFIWEQYSFKHLPAEVISAIYENFIQAESIRQNGGSEKGVVYTPIHLVNFLIDEIMPLNKPELFNKEIFKILDPACGSGVFLVAAYKRLLQWWAINNSTNNEIHFPQSKVAQKILEDNIFGIDIKETATLVSIFGLTTALLDKLTPQEIWNNFKFKDLSKKNIQHKNFFEWAIIEKDKKHSFDLVIGNPPFNPITGVSKANAVSKEQLALFNLTSLDIPDNNFALKFLEGGLFFGKNICMIIPSNIILYNKDSQEYRNRLFKDYSVKKIFDFTHLRRDLFHKAADTPVVSVIIENKPSRKELIEHIVIKRMISSEKKIRFEIDYYDRHSVKWDFATDASKQFVWKTNLLGGGRLFHFIYRLSLLETLGKYIEEKKKSNNWKFNIGYIIGNSSQPKKADYITGQDSIIKIDSNGNITTQTETSKTFEATRDESLFRPPFLLLKDIIGDDSIPAYLVETYKKKYLVFKRNFTAISVPDTDLNDLKKIYRFVKSKYAKLYQLYIISISASALVKQETYINKEDIEALPFPEEEEYLKLSHTEEILKADVLKYYTHLGKSISGRGAGIILTKKVTESQLRNFGKVYCEVLNSIYAKNGKSWQIGRVQQSPMFTIYQFGFGKNNSLDYSYTHELDDSIKDLLHNKISNRGAIYSRVIRIYKHLDALDCVYFIKPNAQRYWFNSIALRDADETFVDLKKGGY